MQRKNVRSKKAKKDLKLCIKGTSIDCKKTQLSWAWGKGLGGQHGMTANCFE